MIVEKCSGLLRSTAKRQTRANLLNMSKQFGIVREKEPLKKHGSWLSLQPPPLDANDLSSSSSTY